MIPLVVFCSNEIMIIQDEVKVFEERYKDLNDNCLEPLVQDVDDLVDETSDLRKQIQQYRTDHKVDDVSLYAEIDDIFNKYKIHRSAYHSGQINGVGIKLLMDNATEIMGEIKELFLQRQTDSSVAHDQICDFCNHMTQFFTLWDDAFSLVHTIDPVEKDFVDAQNTIDQALQSRGGLA